MQDGILTPTFIGATGHWPHYIAVVYSSHAKFDNNESNPQMLPSTWDPVSFGLQFRGPVADQCSTRGGHYIRGRAGYFADDLVGNR